MINNYKIEEKDFFKFIKIIYFALHILNILYSLFFGTAKYTL